MLPRILLLTRHGIQGFKAISCVELCSAKLMASSCKQCLLVVKRIMHERRKPKPTTFRGYSQSCLAQQLDMDLRSVR